MTKNLQNHASKDMDHEGNFRFILLLVLMSFVDVQSQSCPHITINDLGSTMEFSMEGLIAQAIVSSESTIPVRIRNFMIVCDAAGDRISTSSYVSVVVEFQCNSQSANPSLTVCNDPSTIVTRQYQFQCIDSEQNGQSVWASVVAGSNLFIQTLNPTATLSTPLVDTCRRCIDDQQSNRSDSTTHCDRESSIDYVTLSLLIMIIVCPQRVQHNVTRGRDVAFSHKPVMCAVTFTFKIIV